MGIKDLNYISEPQMVYNCFYIAKSMTHLQTHLLLQYAFLRSLHEVNPNQVFQDNNSLVV